MAGLGGRRQRRNWQLTDALCALLLIASAAYTVRQISHGGLEPSDIVSVLGFLLTAAGFVAGIRALRKPLEGNDAERARGQALTLARQVEAGESAVWRQLLGDDIRRINLTYMLHPAAVRPAAAPPAGRLSADGPGPATVPDIVTYYRATRPSRLVITGAPGAGKTVLALELLLALTDSRTDDDPVPVRVPLSQWDTDRQSLPDHLQQRLVDAYDWPADLAADLIRHHLVLPVLDGLDEMDPLLADGSPDPAAPRATAVIRALNLYQQGRDAGPLILTCRTRHYDTLAPGTTLLDAARIAIAPVTTSDAYTYLAARARDTARWQPLLDQLAAHPGGVLAAVLSTPWRLCLTATVYHGDGNPAELLALPNADALDEHLLARFIPAATRTAPNPHDYTPEDAHRWLHHLTTHLDPTGTLQPAAPARAEATDLVLHELWPFAGRTRVRATDTLISTLTVLITLPLTCIPTSLPSGQLAAAVVVLAVVFGMAVALGAPTPMGLNDLFTTFPPRRNIAAGLTGGIVLGITAGIKAGFTAGLTIGITFGLMGWVVLGSGPQKPGRRCRARDVIRDDCLAGLTFALTVGLTLGVLSGFRSGLTGLVLGVVGGMAGLAAGFSTSRRYAVFLLCSRRRLPLQLGLFLDWAVTAGLMRYSGPAYQYRHRELQHWLRRHPHPPTST
ncbi:NACHT domain-containing protein [Streptomyces sp. BH-SS-21]|uniref:NACHT domain-containing protein n=1 Tax=Streptomyces liliiviolaceus TaxID=2823109 RepID=A0A940XVD7_9ACTN|nr:NACHT domain-containing protein [Streptomyces liliiviolaceus]MBQ0850328.1 NACHT domain-containing protein [Streptomyces liliiviolaceus]